MNPESGKEKEINAARVQQAWDNLNRLFESVKVRFNDGSGEAELAYQLVEQIPRLQEMYRKLDEAMVRYRDQGIPLKSVDDFIEQTTVLHDELQKIMSDPEQLKNYTVDYEIINKELQTKDE